MTGIPARLAAASGAFYVVVVTIVDGEITVRPLPAVPGPAPIEATASPAR